MQQPKWQNLQQKTPVVGTAPKPVLCICNPKSQLVRSTGSAPARVPTHSGSHSQINAACSQALKRKTSHVNLYFLSVVLQSFFIKYLIVLL